MVNGIHDGLTSKLLSCSDEAKAALTQLVQVIQQGRAESIVSDITLRVTNNRPADQSPYEIPLSLQTKGRCSEVPCKTFSSLAAPVKTQETKLRSVGSSAPTGHARGH